MRHRHPPETEARVTELWGAGLSVRQIAEDTGLTRDTVDHLRARMKLPLRIVHRKPPVLTVFNVAAPIRIDAGREPLPPMHPISWGAIQP